MDGIYWGSQQKTTDGARGAGGPGGLLRCQFPRTIRRFGLAIAVWYRLRVPWRDSFLGMGKSDGGERSNQPWEPTFPSFLGVTVFHPYFGV